MKKLILWIIKVFKLDINTTIIKEVERISYLPKNGIIEGDVTIIGDVIITGSLIATGDIICHKKGGGNGSI